jgi:putative membrane protein
MKSFVPALLIALAATPALAQTQPPGQTDTEKAPSTQSFVGEAQVGTQFEIQAAQIALSKTQSPGVRQFAKRMIRDHSRAGHELGRVLAEDRQAAPSQPPGEPPLSSDQTEKLQHLQSLSGADFDRSYVAIMVKDHQDDVGLFRAYAHGGDDPHVKAFARKVLPMIESHLRMAQKLQRREAASG